MDDNNLINIDKIVLEGLFFYGYHGVMNEEKALGQKFYIDLELYCSLQKAGKEDELTESIDYAGVYFLVRNIVEKERYDLIEALAEKIAWDILDKYDKIKGVMVYVKKPEAPLPGQFANVGVRIRRFRGDGKKG